MKRRKFFAGATLIGTSLLSGCISEIGAMAANAKAGLTGHVEEPRSLWIRNEDDQEHTVSVVIKGTAGTIVFRDRREIPGNSEVENVWSTTRVGRYNIVAETGSGLSGSGSMRVCVGYYTTGVTIYPESIEIGQVHGDPIASHCTVGGAS